MIPAMLVLDIIPIWDLDNIPLDTIPFSLGFPKISTRFHSTITAARL